MSKIDLKLEPSYRLYSSISSAFIAGMGISIVAVIIILWRWG